MEWHISGYLTNTALSMLKCELEDTGFVYSTAYGPDIVQRDVWICSTIVNGVF